MIKPLPLLAATPPAPPPPPPPPPTATPTAPPLDLAPVQAIVERCGRDAEQVLPILQALQRHYRYLPPAALQRVCELTAITPAQIVGVATFYKQFRHQPSGRRLVRVCHGTACHVAGADPIHDAFARALHLAPGQHTDADGHFTLEKVACLGCCSLAPVVQIGAEIFGNLTPDAPPYVLQDVLSRGEHPAAAAPTATQPTVDADLTGEIRIALDSCCLARGADKVFAAFHHAIATHRLPVTLRSVGCLGLSCHSPLVEVVRPGLPPVLYRDVRPEEVETLALRHFAPRGWWRRLRAATAHALDRLLWPADDHHPASWSSPATPRPQFLEGQVRLATEHSGELDPLDLDGYRRRGGFDAFTRAREAAAPEALIVAIEQSGLRGRGGAGYPTGRKWRQVRAAAGTAKYVICNGDEGDPGAFMDRMVLESYPFRVIEGLALAALAVGAEEGIFYIREEYPLAVRRIEAALQICAGAGLLVPPANAHLPPLNFRVVQGAGAFVCGEETALIAALEGRRGVPRLRPPYPSTAGFRGCPTLINNVETLAVVPWILRHGPAAFAQLGTPQAPGTKVFALAGKVRRSGLVEVPMGATLRSIIEDLGGGIRHGRAFKAVQIGGPSGGCLPAALLDTPVDYDALQAAGAIMGSGGMVVLDQDDCMVDLARYFVAFAADEACGRCSIGRVGTRRLLDILERLCAGQGRPADLTALETLGHGLQLGSLCGLCRTAPNPVLSTLRYFREEYEAHLAGRCPAGRCKALIRYSIESTCIGCTLCAQHCPADAIPVTPYHVHTIDPLKCTRCDACRQVCPVAAVTVR